MNKAAHKLNLQAQEIINRAMCELGRSLTRADAIWIVRRGEQAVNNKWAEQRYYEKEQGRRRKMLPIMDWS